MRAGSHILIGAAAVIVWDHIAPYLPGEPLALGLALAAEAIGSLLPDLDADESAIRRALHTARSDGLIGRLASRIMPAHRGITHSGLAALIAFAIAWARPAAWAQAAAIGYLAHLAADLITIGGIPLLWPVRRRLSLLPIHTSGIAEQGIALSAGLYALAIYLGRSAEFQSFALWLRRLINVSIR